MDIKRSGSQPSAKGPAEWFTGTVCIDPLFDAPVPARAAGASVALKALARRTAMTHIAIREELDGNPVNWLEHVAPEQYEGRSGGS